MIHVIIGAIALLVGLLLLEALRTLSPGHVLTLIGGGIITALWSFVPIFTSLKTNRPWQKMLRVKRSGNSPNK